MRRAFASARRDGERQPRFDPWWLSTADRLDEVLASLRCRPREDLDRCRGGDPL